MIWLERAALFYVCAIEDSPRSEESTTFFCPVDFRFYMHQPSTAEDT